MPAPNVTGYEQIITGGALVNFLTDTSGFLQQIQQIDDYNATVCDPNRIPAASTYYFHYDNGNDDNPGTSGLPMKHLINGVGLALVNGGGVRLRLARGQTWVDTTGMQLTDVYSVAVDDYGNPNDSLPCISALQNLDAFNNSVLITSGTYRLNLVNTPFSGQQLHWVVEGADNSLEFHSPYIEVSTSGAVHNAGSGTFHWASGSNLLYYKPWLPVDETTVLRGTNTQVNGILFKDSASTSGISTIGQATVKNIRVQGYGVNPIDPNVYCVRVQAPNTEVRFENVETYYSRFHNIGHVSQVGARTHRTRTVYKNCKAGYCLYNAAAGSASITLYVDYNALGNNEFYYIGNASIGGGLITKEYFAAWSTGHYGTTEYAHTNGGSDKIALGVSINHINVASGNASGRRYAITPSTFGDTPPHTGGRHNITGYRAYVYGNQNSDYPMSQLPTAPNMIFLNSTYYHDLRGQVVFTNCNMIASGGYSGSIFAQNRMNLYILNSTFAGGSTAMFSRSSKNGIADYDYGVTFSNNHIHIIRNASQTFAVGDISATGGAAYHASQLIVENNILTTNSSGVGIYLSLPQTIPNYGNGVRPTGGGWNNRSYGWDTGRVTNFFEGISINGPQNNRFLPATQLSVTGTRPLVGNTAYRAASGIPGTTLDIGYDFTNNPRASLYSIGLFEEAPSPTVATGLTGVLNTPNSTGTLVWTDPTAFGVSGYYVETTTNGTVASGFWPYASGTTYVSNIGLSYNQTFSYRIATLNENSELSDYSNSFSLTLTNPYSPGSGVIFSDLSSNRNNVKFAVLGGNTSRLVAKTDVSADNSKLTDRLSINSGILRDGTILNPSVVTTDYEIIDGSGDMSKNAESLIYRVGLNRIKKNI